MTIEALVAIAANPKVPEFRPGDTVRVSVRVREGDRERIQAFEGFVLRRQGKQAGASFTVRRVTHGVGVERTFPLFSPLLDSVNVLRRGQVRRAKLYYLRQLSGKAARIKEKRI